MKKNLTTLMLVIVIATLSVCVFSCTKTDDDNGQIPTVTTSAVSGVAKTTAGVGGNVTSDGGNAVTARGVVWSTTENPTISGNKSIDGSGTGSFISNISGLTANTTYYLRAYATNSVGTAYGNQISFTTIASGSTRVFDVTLVEVHTDTIQGTGGDARHTCVKFGVAKIPADPDAVKYTVLASGTGISFIDGKVWTWNVGDQNPGAFVGYGLPRGLHDGVYNMAVTTLRNGDGPYNPSTPMEHTPSITLAGKVEVTVHY